MSEEMKKETVVPEELFIPDVNTENDYAVSAMTADGMIRAFACTSRNLVEEARSRHNTSPVMTAALGRLLTAAVMIGSQMKGEKDTLTLQVKGDGPAGYLVAVADSEGHVKGYAAEPQVLLHANKKGKLDVAGAVGKGTLIVTRDIGLKEPYTGTIELISGEIAEDITYYYAVSEQTPSSVGLGVLMNKENTVRRAGGFMIQLMPGVDDDTISRLEKRIGELPPVTTMLEDGLTPEEILGQILGEFGLIVTGKKDISFRCGCSRERVADAIRSLGRREILDLTVSREVTEARCDYCNTTYRFDRAEMKEIYKKARASEKGENVRADKTEGK